MWTPLYRLRTRDGKPSCDQPKIDRGFARRTLGEPNQHIVYDCRDDGHYKGCDDETNKDCAWHIELEDEPRCDWKTEKCETHIEHNSQLPTKLGVPVA
jgi:hypothetical protein